MIERITGLSDRLLAGVVPKSTALAVCNANYCCRWRYLSTGPCYRKKCCFGPGIPEHCGPWQRC